MSVRSSILGLRKGLHLGGQRSVRLASGFLQLTHAAVDLGERFPDRRDHALEGLLASLQIVGRLCPELADRLRGERLEGVGELVFEAGSIGGCLAFERECRRQLGDAPLELLTGGALGVALALEAVNPPAQREPSDESPHAPNPRTRKSAAITWISVPWGRSA